MQIVASPVHERNTEAPARTASIRIENLSKTYQENAGSSVVALEEINLNLPANSFVSLLGPSGSGKSTLLKLIAGIERPSNGVIRCHAEVVDGVNTGVAYVPQGRGLFPWMTLLGNIEFPLKIAGVAPAERRRKALQWIERVKLGGFENKFPRQLSGGMEKRGSLARALITDKPILLMDEPFGPLDAQTRLSLQQQLTQLWEDVKNTVVFVTHDVIEAIALSDLVVVLSSRPGRILDVVTVTLPRPRNVLSVPDCDGFAELHARLQQLLFREQG
ncbi:MAG: sulfonate transport system ATP-binding protein [Gammaproteobacteria bacterium]|jgi:NitT/TauT family transport system ATP-binding protein|nr:sulfonate transport system ATP-binding protein [Gammaproteobacteria bacterium]